MTPNTQDTADGREWPTREQGRVIEARADEFGRIGIERDGDRALLSYRAKSHYGTSDDTVEIVEPDGSVQEKPLGMPDAAQVPLATALVERLVGDAQVIEYAMANAAAFSRAYSPTDVRAGRASAHRFGEALAPRVTLAIERLLAVDAAARAFAVDFGRDPGPELAGVYEDAAAFVYRLQEIDADRERELAELATGGDE